MKIFGREPIWWLTAIKAGIMLAIAWGLFSATEVEVTRIMAVVAAAFGVLVAYLARDAMLGFITGLIEAVFALLLGYGVNISPDKMATVLAVVTIVVGAWQRTQTGPATVPAFASEAA